MNKLKDLLDMPKETYKQHWLLHGNKVHLFGIKGGNRWWKCELCHKLTKEELLALTKTR